MNGTNWLITARAVFDFLFKWAGVWLFMNSITYGVGSFVEARRRRRFKRDAARRMEDIRRMWREAENNQSADGEALDVSHAADTGDAVEDKNAAAEAAGTSAEPET